MTLACALFLGLETATYAGVILSLLLFLNQAAHPGIRDVKPSLGGASFNFNADTGLPDCPQLKMLRINGSIFFGAGRDVEAFHAVDRYNPRQKKLLIAASGINVVDISSAELLAREARRRRKMGGALYFHFMKDTVSSQSYTLDSEICRTCQARTFHNAMWRSRMVNCGGIDCSSEKFFIQSRFESLLVM